MSEPLPTFHSVAEAVLELAVIGHDADETGEHPIEAVLAEVRRLAYIASETTARRRIPEGIEWTATSGVVSATGSTPGEALQALKAKLRDEGADSQ